MNHQKKFCGTRTGPPFLLVVLLHVLGTAVVASAAAATDSFQGKIASR